MGMSDFCTELSKAQQSGWSFRCMREGIRANIHAWHEYEYDICTYVYTHMYMYVRIYKGERGRERERDLDESREKGNFCLRVCMYIIYIYILLRGLASAADKGKPSAPRLDVTQPDMVSMKQARKSWLCRCGCLVKTEGPQKSRSLGRSHAHSPKSPSVWPKFGLRCKPESGPGARNRTLRVSRTFAITAHKILQSATKYHGHVNY